MADLRIFETHSLRHMSLPAATSGLIHALAALALVWSLPPRAAETLERAFDVTLEPLAPARVERPSAPAPDAEQAIAPPEPASPVDVAAEEPPPPAMPPQPTDPSPEPARTTLEQSLPPVDEPPPFSTRELAHAAPTLAPPRPRVAPTPAAQRGPEQVAEAERAIRRRAQEDYLVGMIQKLSRYRFVPSAQQATAHGIVVMRVTLARDGRVLDVALTRSSGFPVLDQGLLDTVHRASPFAQLPGDISGIEVSFTVPIEYDRER